jgi:hypothetical protein
LVLALIAGLVSVVLNLVIPQEAESGPTEVDHVEEGSHPSEDGDAMDKEKM